MGRIMMIRQQDEMEDVDSESPRMQEIGMRILNKKGGNNMKVAAKSMTTIGEVVSKTKGVDVKDLLRKMGALKEGEAPVAPEDIAWDNPAELMKVWEKAQQGVVPKMWNKLDTTQLNEKLQRLVKAIRNPKKEEPVKKIEVKKAANFGDDEGRQSFKVTDKRRRVVEEPKEEADIDGFEDTHGLGSVPEEFDEAPAVAKDTKRDTKKARRKNMDSKTKVVEASTRMKAQMQAMESASALASLSQFKPKEDEDKVFTVLTLETQRNGKSKVIFRGGASKFLRPIKMIFGDGMDIVAADEETLEFMQVVQKEIVAIIKRNQ